MLARHPSSSIYPMSKSAGGEKTKDIFILPFLSITPFESVKDSLSLFAVCVTVIGFLSPDYLESNSVKMFPY